MKTLTVSIAILATSTAFASAFKVIDPVITTERIPVPIANLSCQKGPFGMSQLQVKLPKQVGSPGQNGVLKSDFMGGLGDSECNAIIMNLLKFSNGETVELEARVEARSVVKLGESNSYNCEGAQQEVVSMNVGGTTARESIFSSEGELSCPDGLYPYHVRSRDDVIYVLHENGIPTKSDY